MTMNAMREGAILSELCFRYIHGGVFAQRSDAPVQRDWRINPYDMMVCSITGDMKVQTAETTTCVEQGDCIYIPAGLRRRSRLSPQNGENKLCNMAFSYTCLGAVNFLSLFTVKEHFTGRDAVAICKIVSELNALDVATEMPPITKKVRELKAGFALLDILMGDSRLQAGRTAILRRHSKLSTLLAELKASPEIRRTVSDMARSVGVSKPRLYQLFNTLTGCAPQEYLRIQRLRKAAGLLLTTDDTVAEIADQLGYPDPFCFSKSFKKLFGISPAFHRKKTDLW